MLLKPRPETAVRDPFAEYPTLILICDVHEPRTGEHYGRGPRGVAKRAEKYLVESSIGDTAYFGPEAEFFVFDSVRFSVEQQPVVLRASTRRRGPTTASGKEYEQGNLGHRPRPKGGYFGRLRNRSITARHCATKCLPSSWRWASTSRSTTTRWCRASLSRGVRFNTLVRCADDMPSKFKYVVHNVAAAHGKSATFMPRPVMHDNGSGMHTHQSIWKDGKSMFAGDGYDGLSETALFYIGGIIKHARALNAFTNPTTNSYKRLVPGYTNGAKF